MKFLNKIWFIFQEAFVLVEPADRSKGFCDQCDMGMKRMTCRLTSLYKKSRTPKSEKLFPCQLSSYNRLTNGKVGGTVFRKIS